MLQYLVLVKKNPIILWFIINYNLNDQLINRVNIINDLGIIFDSKLSFTCHIDSIKKAFQKLLIRIRRRKTTCKDFQDVISLKLLYCILVHSYN